MLGEMNVRPSKQRGQNFIKDTSVLDQIVEFGAPKADETIVEIGPGLGALTQRLAAIGKVTAIEIEERFCAQLRRMSPNITVVNEDFRGVELSGIGSKLTVFGNIPYSYSTDIVFHLINNAPLIDRAILMLQKEFAQRIASPPGKKSFGALSVGCQLWADITLGPIIPGDSFHPPTEVESQVIEMKFFDTPRHDVGDLFHFRRVVQAAFSQRRKKLHNSMRSSGTFPGDVVDRALEAAGIDPNRRAETLSLAEFASLSRALGPENV